MCNVFLANFDITVLLAQKGLPKNVQLVTAVTAICKTNILIHAFPCYFFSRNNIEALVGPADLVDTL